MTTFTPEQQTEFRRLLDEFERLALKAGASNSGYVIDVAAGARWDFMKEKKSELMMLITGKPL